MRLGGWREIRFPHSRDPDASHIVEPGTGKPATALKEEKGPPFKRTSERPWPGESPVPPVGVQLVFNWCSTGARPSILLAVILARGDPEHPPFAALLLLPLPRR